MGGIDYGGYAICSLPTNTNMCPQCGFESRTQDRCPIHGDNLMSTEELGLEKTLTLRKQFNMKRFNANKDELMSGPIPSLHDGFKRGSIPCDDVEVDLLPEDVSKERIDEVYHGWKGFSGTIKRRTDGDCPNVVDD